MQCMAVHQGERFSDELPMSPGSQLDSALLSSWLERKSALCEVGFLCGALPIVVVQGDRAKANHHAIAVAFKDIGAPDALQKYWGR